MAVKTITIDVEAYDILTRHKKPGQSFSQVIKEQLGARHTAPALLRAASSFRLAPTTVDAIARQVRTRRKDRARAPRL